LSPNDVVVLFRLIAPPFFAGTLEVSPPPPRPTWLRPFSRPNIVLTCTVCIANTHTLQRGDTRRYTCCAYTRAICFRALLVLNGSPAFESAVQPILAVTSPALLIRQYHTAKKRQPPLTMRQKTTSAPPHFRPCPILPPCRIYIKKKPVYHPPAYKPAEPYKPAYESSSSYSGGEYAKAAASNQVVSAVKPDNAQASSSNNKQQAAAQPAAQ
jgi:hypothetical protein